MHAFFSQTCFDIANYPACQNNQCKAVREVVRRSHTQPLRPRARAGKRYHVIQQAPLILQYGIIIITAWPKSKVRFAPPHTWRSKQRDHCFSRWSRLSAAVLLCLSASREIAGVLKMNTPCCQRKNSEGIENAKLAPWSLGVWGPCCNRKGAFWPTFADLKELGRQYFIMQKCMVWVCKIGDFWINNLLCSSKQDALFVLKDWSMLKSWWIFQEDQQQLPIQTKVTEEEML